MLKLDQYRPDIEEHSGFTKRGVLVHDIEGSAYMEGDAWRPFKSFKKIDTIANADRTDRFIIRLFSFRLQGLTARVLLVQYDDKSLYSHNSGNNRWSSALPDDFNLDNIDRLEFQEFGEDLYMVGGGNCPFMKYDKSSGKFSTSNIVGSNYVDGATTITVIRDFLVLGGFLDHSNRVIWSQINNGDAFTPGEEQSDFQDIPDDSKVLQIVGRENGIIFTNRGIYRISFAGYPLIFQIDNISKENNLLATGLAINIGNDILYLADSGFWIISGGQTLYPIGRDKIDVTCLLYTSPSPRDRTRSRMPSSA